MYFSFFLFLFELSSTSRIHRTCYLRQWLISIRTLGQGALLSCIYNQFYFSEHNELDQETWNLRAEWSKLCLVLERGLIKMIQAMWVNTTWSCFVLWEKKHRLAVASWISRSLTKVMPLTRIHCFVNICGHAFPCSATLMLVSKHTFQPLANQFSSHFYATHEEALSVLSSEGLVGTVCTPLT